MDKALFKRRNLAVSRASGRTQRMLVEAIKDATNGKYVMVVSMDSRHAHELCRRAYEIAPEGTTRADVVRRRLKIGAGCIEFICNDRNVDWRHMRVVGQIERDVFRADHATIEKVWERMLTELHRHD